MAPVAQLDRVPGYELGGREFESLRARQLNQRLTSISNLLKKLIARPSPVTQPFAARLTLVYDHLKKSLFTANYL